MAERIKDMTSGKPAGLLLSFALPLMLGSICQQLYTMVDTMVVGQVLGVEALAALGAAVAGYLHFSGRTPFGHSYFR